MPRRNFYFLALWLPVMFPMIAWIYGRTAGGDVPAIMALLVASAAFGGVQYILFAIVIAYWFGHKDTAFIRRMSWWLPIWFIPVCTVGLAWMFVPAIISGKQTIGAVAGFIEEIALYIGLMSLLYGYAYVLLAHGLVFLLIKCGFIWD